MYMQDHDNKFPMRETVWAEVSFPPKALTCPTYGAKKGNGYGYNYWLSLKCPTDSGMPEVQDLPVLMDSKANNNLVQTSQDIDGRHTSKTVVAFADGHVELRLPADIPISAFTDHELFGETWPDWPVGKSDIAIQEQSMPNGWWVPAYCLEMDCAKTGWISPVLSDPTNTCSCWDGIALFSTWRQGGDALFLGGKPYHYGFPAGYTGNPAETYLRIPIPAGSNSISAAGSWVISLPNFRYAYIGGLPTVNKAKTPPDPPQIGGWAEVNVCDSGGSKIASYRLNCTGTSVEYSFQGSAFATLSSCTVPTLHWAYQDGPAGTIDSYTFTGADKKHNLMIMGTGDGTLLCALSSDQPGAQGVVHASAGPGDVLQPSYVELRVSCYKGGAGDGTINVAVQSSGGGMNWGAGG